MRVLGTSVLVCGLVLVFAGCSSDSGGGGTGGAATGGAGGAGAGGTSSGGTSSGGAAGSGGGGTCSVLSWNGCPVFRNCMNTKCGTEIEACYGPNFANDEAAGSKCESLWSCSKTCTCGDTACLIGTCYTSAPADCKTCTEAISNCATAPVRRRATAVLRR
ncbi:MAG: hypothetical protein U0263_40835 [Polyangiaceae bacterium]